MKWYFLFRIQHAGHNGITKHTPFYDLIRCFQYSVRVTTTGNRKTVLPLYVFFFSTIKTRNSTIRFSFLFFRYPAHSTRRRRVMSFFHAHTHTKKFKLLRRACKWVGVVFIILCTRKGPEGHTFSLIENKSSWPHVPRGTLFLIRCSVRIMLYYMIYPRGRCPFFTTSHPSHYI